jgi:hypothetical protein
MTRAFSNIELTSGNFYWFHGIVEDVSDPLMMGRVRVRCIGYHNENKLQLATASLPWALPILPITSPSKAGVGISATGLAIDSWVVGFFRDGAAAQEPVIIGSIATKTNGALDIPTAARGTAITGSLPSAYTSKVGPVYPNNKVTRTSSGHTIEYDDTPGKERVALTHKSGSTIQMLNDGTIVIASAGKDIEINAGTPGGSGGDVIIKGKNIRLN